MKRIMKPPGGDSHDIFGQEFNGSPSHHRVLKPPGGGSSDIFGADGATPRRARLQQQAGSLGTLMGEGAAPAPPRKAQNGASSHSRLFGPPAEGGLTPARNRMKSNIVLGEAAQNGADSPDGAALNGSNESLEDAPSVSDSTAGSLVSDCGGPMSKPNIVLHNDILKPQRRVSCRRPDGNPVTGNGYPDSSSESSKMSNGSSNGSMGRSRVPPGGFSSGLW